MFEDGTLSSASFKAKQTKQVGDVSSQTLDIETVEGGVQTENESGASSTQTTYVQPPVKKGKGKPAEAQEAQQRQVAQCMAKVGDLMLREVAKNGSRSSWFSGFEHYLDQSDQNDSRHLYHLLFDSTTYFESQGSQLACTGVSWNATGSVIAVAYGRFDHSGWCNYRSALCLWNVFQSDFKPDKPALVLETSSGLMCVSFHPLNPSIVAAGSFNGEVFVWDTEPVEYKFFSSGIGDYFHRDPVTKVAWVYDLQSADYNIASISMDGKILFWRLKDKLAFPVEGYEMHLPLTDGIKPRNTTACSPVLGGKTMAVNTLDKTTRAFILGSEGGLVARCFANANATSRASEFKGEKKWTATAARLLSNLPPSKLQSARRQVEAHASAKRSKDVTLATVYEARLNPASLFPNALDFLFDAHLGPVYDATFSPFRKNTFLTASADGTLRLYSTRQRACLLSMDVSPSSAYLYAVQWSRTRPAVFATASEDGHVYVFDLTVDHVNPVATLSGKVAPEALNATVATTSESGAPMFALDFNPRQRNFLAAGDGAGVVHIWKLSWQLATLQTRETEVLEALEGKNG